MTIQDMADILSAKVLLGEDKLDTPVHTACCSDLMSDVLAFVDEKTVLITGASGEMVTVTAWKSVYASYVHAMETAINGCPRRWWGKTREHKKILAEGKPLPEWIPFTVVPYDLRYSFCTWCRDNHVELKTCVRWMGHKDAKMILRIYDDAPDSRSKSEAERLEKTLFRSGNGSGSEEGKPETPIS